MSVKAQSREASVGQDARAAHLPERSTLIEPESAVRACRDLIGLEVVAVDCPGGPLRRSVRARGRTESVIVTRRAVPARAELEAGVLRELRSAGAPVPAPHAFDGHWLIQEDLGGVRLSAALDGADVMRASALASRGAESLLRCQRAGRAAGLAERVRPIGVEADWLSSLIGVPGRIAVRLGLRDPGLEDALDIQRLRPRRLTFIKWDARPGNAMVGANGETAAWFDWEHCGARDALDDLAWLLCDEYMPDHAGLERALLERWVPEFARHSGRELADAHEYLARIGSLHSAQRLMLVLEQRDKSNGAWWGSAACLHDDRIGVTAKAARRLCSRGARWSRRWHGGERLANFFRDVDACLRAGATEFRNPARAVHAAFA